MAKSGWIFETSSQMTGVPLDQLHCPSCGVKILDFKLHSDPDEFDVLALTPPIAVTPASDWYILCPRGHKWSVKTIWRAVNHPDRVQLDRYLGCLDL